MNRKRKEKKNPQKEKEFLHSISTPDSTMLISPILSLKKKFKGLPQKQVLKKSKGEEKEKGL